MRQLGTVSSETEARRFADFLLAQGITTKVDAEPAGWAIWVRHEEHLERARSEWDAFQANPADPRYDSSAREAKKVREEEARRDREARKNIVDVRTRWSTGATPGSTPVTWALIAICVMVGFATQFGKNTDGLIRELTVVRWQVTAADPPESLLDDWKHGEVWRLVTPMFIHWGGMHLFFNMYWMLVLGRQVESVVGSWRYLLIVLLAQLAGSIPEYLLGHYGVGGMSGVVYGLAAYAWMQSRYGNEPRLFISQQTIILLGVWFVVCIANTQSGVANWAHGGGLAMGIVLGLLPVWRQHLRRR